MSTDIANNADGGTVIAVEQAYGDDIFAGLATSGKYLPLLKLCGAGSEEVKEGKIGVAHYGLKTSKDLIEDLGKEVDIIPIVWRPKAMDVSGDDIINCHEPKHPEFERIVIRSDIQNSQCFYGLEFLVWIPSVNKFAAYFMQSKTARRESPAVRERLGKPSTMYAEFIKSKQFSWHGPKIKPCSTPFDLPDLEKLSEETTRFNNPPAFEKEAAEPVSPGRKT